MRGNLMQRVRRRAASTAAAAVIGLSGLAPVPGMAADDLLGDVDFKNRKCNEAFHHYLSCFAGENMRRCYARMGREQCDREHALARGDLGVAWAMFSAFGSSGCAPETYQMIDRNLITMRRLFGCESW